MALSEAQRNKVAKILRITPDLLYLHLTSGAFEMTATRQTDIEAELDRWDLYGGKFIRVEPNLKNFGAKIDPELIKTEIRENLAGLLERQDWCSSSSGVEYELVRG